MTSNNIIVTVHNYGFDEVAIYAWYINSEYEYEVAILLNLIVIMELSITLAIWCDA